MQSTTSVSDQAIVGNNSLLLCRLQCVDYITTLNSKQKSRNKLLFRATVTFDKEETIRGILTYAGDGGRVTKYHVQFWNSQTYQFEDIAVSFIS